MPTTKAELLQGTLDLLILKTLSAGAMHGYAIAQRIQERSEDVLIVEEGSLYPALYRMEESRLLKAEWEDTPERQRGPRRRIYRLTPKGKRQLAAGRKEWQEFVTVIGGILGAAT